MNLRDEKVTQAKGEEVDKVGKHREADNALTNFNQQMTCNGSEPASAINLGNSSKWKRSGEGNPFLVSPLRLGEKEVSSVVLPAKLSNEAFLQHLDHAVVDNYVSALDTYAPSIEAVKHRHSKAEDGKKIIPLNMRPAVQFKLGGGKKSFHMASRSQNEDIEKIDCWFHDNDDDENDDKKKKRRVELILKKSCENSQ